MSATYSQVGFDDVAWLWFNCLIQSDSGTHFVGGRREVDSSRWFNVFGSLFYPGTDGVEDVSVLDYVVEVVVAGYDAGESAVVCPQ